MFLDNLDKPNDNGTPVMITSCRVPIGRTRSVDAGAAPPRRHTASYVEQHNQSNFPNTIGITCTGGSHEGNHEDVQLPFPCFLDKCEVSEAKVVEHPAVAAFMILYRKDVFLNFVMSYMLFMNFHDHPAAVLLSKHMFC